MSIKWFKLIVTPLDSQTTMIVDRNGLLLILSKRLQSQPIIKGFLKMIKWSLPFSFINFN